MVDQEEKEKNIRFFEENLDSWLSDVAYLHKHVIISGGKVEGIFDSFSDALNYAAAHFSPEEFIIQQVIGKDEQTGFLKLAM